MTKEADYMMDLIIKATKNTRGFLEGGKDAIRVDNPSELPRDAEDMDVALVFGTCYHFLKGEWVRTQPAEESDIFLYTMFRYPYGYLPVQMTAEQAATFSDPQAPTGEELDLFVVLYPEFKSILFPIMK